MRAAQIGLTEQQIANDLNTSLSSSFQVSPNFWADPKTGVPYQVAVQTPEYRLSTMSDLENTPLRLSGRDGAKPETLSNVATLSRELMQTLITHSNIQRTFDIYANVQDRDLGLIEADLKQILPEFQSRLKPGNQIVLRGQMKSKNDAFLHLGLGLVGALVFVYLLMVLNFQNWGDPFVVLAALPLAFCGIVGSLFITQTTFSIPSLMGAIMSIGVASANSILLVTFAREHREATGCSAVEAAIMAGRTRLRPVLMTAGAMFVGMLPMSLGLAEGSEAECGPCQGGPRRHRRRHLFHPVVRSLPLCRAAARRGAAAGGLRMNIREPLPTGDEKVAPLSDERPPSRRLYFLVTVVVLGALAWGAYGRWQQRAAAIETQQSTTDFVPEVRVAVAIGQDGPVVLTLPGTVLPFDQARIFARATGYVAERHVDIGSRVAKGDLLLRIAAPISTISFQRPRPGWCRWKARWNRRVPQPNSRARMRHSRTSRIPEPCGWRHKAGRASRTPTTRVLAWHRSSRP